MTDLYDIGSKEEVNGEFLVSLTLHTKITSDASDADYNFSSSTNQHMVFDHDPTHEDILAKAAEYNHNFNVNRSSLSEGTVYNNSPIVTITEGEDDTTEWSCKSHKTEFDNMLALVPISLNSSPNSISKKSSWIYIFYLENSKPTQFFSESETYQLYSVRIHESTSEVKRKGYFRDNPLNLEEHREVIGEKPIIGTGVYLDDNAFTLYYPKTLGDEVDPAIVDKPYLGSHFRNNTFIYTREYKHDI
jgi:hypothetical protein|tara:strand:+ start:1539 stop:2276 length:738 start_codon:yes stop_codon:yes gene_type:complete